MPRNNSTTMANRRPVRFFTVGILVAAHLSAHADSFPSTSAQLDKDAPVAEHRNERSTPRNSVLPTSPAIAPYKTRTENPAAVEHAKAILLRLGYHVGRLDNRVTAKFKAALFRYQRARGLPSSGILDAATLRSLRTRYR